MYVISEPLKYLRCIRQSLGNLILVHHHLILVMMAKCISFNFLCLLQRNHSRFKGLVKVTFDNI